MPWFVIPGALRRLRRANKLTQKQAAKKVGFDESTLYRHEYDPPVTFRATTVDAYVRLYRCKPEDFVVWREDSHGERKALPPRALSPVVKRDPSAPKVQTLTERARQELATGARPTISEHGEELEVVGNVIIKECNTAYGLHESKRFAVVGMIVELDAMPAQAERVLQADAGHAVRCRIDRHIVEGLPVYATVYSARAEHTRYLIDAYKVERRVTLIVRVFAKPANGRWKGFEFFENNPIPRPWAFVVEEILPSRNRGI